MLDCEHLRINNMLLIYLHLLVLTYQKLDPFTHSPRIVLVRILNVVYG